MADDLQTNLQTYKLQLQQVEAALTTDPDNPELKNLRGNLEEVINLTSDLILVQQTPAKEVKPVEEKDVKWRLGDRCLAFSIEDGSYRNARVESLEIDGSVTVILDDSGRTLETTVQRLRKHHATVATVASMKDENAAGNSLAAAKRRAAEHEAADLAERLRSKRQQIAKQREYLRKKKAKKLQRFQQLEEERETEKNKWLHFNQKAMGKRGMQKKSIFASPDNVNGRVGIGTCGIGGRPMTEFSATQENKWERDQRSGSSSSSSGRQRKGMQ